VQEAGPTPGFFHWESVLEAAMFRGFGFSLAASLQTPAALHGEDARTELCPANKGRIVYVDTRHCGIAPAGVGSVTNVAAVTRLQQRAVMIRRTTSPQEVPR
jgi:hypothetical protein